MERLQEPEVVDNLIFTSILAGSSKMLRTVSRNLLRRQTSLENAVRRNVTRGFGSTALQRRHNIM